MFFFIVPLALSFIKTAIPAFAEAPTYPIRCMGARDHQKHDDSHDAFTVSSADPAFTVQSPGAELTITSSECRDSRNLTFPVFEVKSLGRTTAPLSVETHAQDIYRYSGLFSADGSSQPHGMVCTIGEARLGMLPYRSPFQFSCTRRMENGRVIRTATEKWTSGLLPVALDLRKKNQFFRTDPRSPLVQVGATTEGHLTFHLKLKLRDGSLSGGTIVDFQPSETRRIYTTTFIVRGEDRPRTEKIRCRLEAL